MVKARRLGILQELDLHAKWILDKARLGETGKVAFLGERLFRTTLDFPANLPTGTYSVEVLLLRGGQVVGAQTTPLIVSKAGFSAEVYDLAHEHAILYGLVAVSLGTMAGWIGGVVFRRA